MNLNEFFEVVWRRKLIILAVMAIVIGLAIGALRLLTPQYEATSSLALTPKPGTAEGVFILQVIDNVVPVYADAATSRITLQRADQQVVGDLADITVSTFENTPIIKIKARDAEPRVAQQSAQAVSEVLLDRAENGTVGIPELRLSQIDRPAVPVEPVFPRTGLTLAVAVLLGLSFGLAAALLRENLTTKVESPEVLARLAGVPSYGEIPAEPAVTRLQSPQELATDTRFRAVSEALRDLRTNLLFSKGNLRSIAVTSPEGSHGKTTVSFGLAVSFARSGARTLLIDADLRRGRVSELLNVQRSPGLSEVLQGHPLDSAIRHTSFDTLDFLTGGRLGEDPGELLMSEFPSILHECERMYEMVIIDATPLVPISDARIVARFAKATLIVASASTATRRQVRTAVERLNLISVQPTAVVLNNYRAPRTAYYYGPSESRNGRGRGKMRTGRRRTTKV